MTFSTTARAIVSILTLLTTLAIIAGVVYGFIAHWPVIAMITGIAMLPAFGIFVYNDYLHYFKNKD